MTNRTPSTRRARRILLVLAALTFAIPAATEAQRRGRADSEAQLAWPSFMAGIKIGYDDKSDGEVLGAQLRLPVLRNGWVEIMPSATTTFANGLKEYQYGVEALVITGGRSGGLYGGGGIAQRNTILGPFPTDPRETISGYTAVLGVRLGGDGGPLGLQVESRWSYFDEIAFDPRVITVGVNFALNGVDPDRDRGRGR